MSLDRNELIAAIRANLKKRSGKPWSVTGGTGTAWGWIKISVPPKRLGCARLCNFDREHVCTACGGTMYAGDNSYCKKHVCTEKCYQGYITPEERVELSALLGLKSVHMQGVSIPSQSDFYKEYLERSEGKTPAIHGVANWD